MKNRLLSKFALLRKIDDFYRRLSGFLRTMCKHMAEKIHLNGDKKGDFNEQMEFRKKSNSFYLEAVPEPWRYNPSQWSQRVCISCVALFAVLIAVYMGLYQWRLIDHIWDPIFGEQSKQVLDSEVSHRMWIWFRIPDAIMGAIAYLGDLIFALAGSTRRWQDRPWLVILFGLDVIPLGLVSAILVFMQKAVVGAWCFLCLVTAVISLVLILLAYDEIWSCILFLRKVGKKSKSFRLVWDTFWGKASEIAYLAGEECIRERAQRKR